MSATSSDVITHLIIVSYVSDGLYLQRIGTALARKVYRRGKLSNSIRVGGEKIKINKSVAAPITILAGMATPVWAEHNIEPYGHIGNLAHEVHYAVHELSGEVTTHLCTDSETEYVLSDLRGVERYASDIERLAHHRVDRRVLSDSIHHLEFVFRHVKYSLKHSDHDLFFQRTSHAYGGGHVVHISEVLYFLDKYIDHLDTAAHKLPPTRRIYRHSHGLNRHGVEHGLPGVVRHRPLGQFRVSLLSGSQSR